ncbi:glycosyltransferase [Marinomonas sp.]|uniref:glycosyltransferase n=1 Tax=Marinomonas sp. TaxID=1904862 RepID=UPI003A958065
MIYKKKVLQVLGDPVGGIRKHVHDIVLNLDHEFDFYYVSSEKVDSKFTEEIGLVDSIIRSRLQLSISKEPSFSDIINIISIFKFVKKNDISIIHGHGAKGGLYARIAGKLCGCKVVYTPHGGAAHNMFSPFKNKIYKLVEKSLYPLTNVFLFESTYTQESFLEKVQKTKNDKTVVNFNGVDLSAYLPVSTTPRKKSILIGFFGMLRKEKGIMFALNVIAKAAKIHSNIEFHVFGDGVLFKDVENRLKELNIENFVTLHGETVTPYTHMKEMDIVFIPSVFESFGYVAVESMIFERTLVFSSAGALPDTCSFNKEFMFEISSIDDAVGKLDSAIAILDTEDNKNRLKLVANIASDKYSIHSMLSGVKRVYEKL